jgi:nucleotide-binding universal stress UspA family protein
MLHVVPIEGVVPAERFDVNEREKMIDYLRDAALRVGAAERLLGAAIRRGDPGTEILRFTRSLPAGLTVLGAAGPERPERPLGSVTATVVARSDCSVLIVPAGWRVHPDHPGLFEHIVCAVDLSTASVAVMRQALSLAWETHARVLHVCVLTRPAPSRADVEARLSAAIPPDARAWCDIDVVIAPGAPATEIVKVAAAAAVDLLVIGPPRRWRSTTEMVLARALSPVLVAHEARPLPYPRPPRKRGGRGPDS